MKGRIITCNTVFFTLKGEDIMKKHIVALIMVLALLAAVIPMQALAAASELFPTITINKSASTNKIEKGGSGQISLTIGPSRRVHEKCTVTIVDSSNKTIKQYDTAELTNTTVNNRYVTVTIDADDLGLKTGDYSVRFWMTSQNPSTAMWETSSDSADIKTYAFEVVSSSCGDDHDYKKTSEVEATCSKTGTIKYTCRDCGHVEIEETEMVDHDYKLDKTWEGYVPPTTTSAGAGYYVCATCPADNRAYKFVDPIPSSAAAKITVGPKDVSVASGKAVTFTVVATGEDLTYQWQYRKAGETSWSDLSVTRSYVTVSATVAKHENQYRCKVTDVFDNTKYSRAATLRIADCASIRTQPKDAWAYDGQKATVSVSATGTDLKYAWYVKDTDDSDFWKSTITSSTYSLTMNEERDGRQVYCVVTAKNGTTATSDTVTLSTRFAAKITKNPVDVVAHGDETISFSVLATGDGPLKYQWYYRNEDATDWTKSSCTEQVYTTKLTVERDGREVYCKVTDKYGNTASSKTATMELVEIKITKQPVSVTASAGNMATFHIEAQGDGLTYQWYYRNADTSSWTKASCKTTTYSTAMTEARHGREIRCIVTDEYDKTKTSKTVTMKLTPVEITEQPKSTKAFVNENITLSIGATGDGLKYTWYYKNPDMSSYKASTVTEPTISVKMNEDRDGRKMYCVVKDKYGQKVTSKTVTLSLKETAEITTQPKSATVSAGETAKFTVKATGDGLKYQWQYKNADSSTWNDSTSGKTATYSFTMKESFDGRSIRCQVKDAYGNTVTSKAVSLKLPVVQITTQPKSQTKDEGETAKFTVKATGDGLKYQWYYRNAGSSTWNKASSTSTTYSTTAKASRDGREIRCLVKDKYGNEKYTKTVKLNVE